MNVNILGFTAIVFKGATSYEMWVGIERLGGIGARIVHLQGEYWRFKPWRRVHVRFWIADKD